MQIRNLWQEHLRDPFPAGCAGEEINGVDLVMLDADTAGLISHVVGGSSLTVEQRKMLDQLIAEFDLVIRELPKNARPYFIRLATIARLI